MRQDIRDKLIVNGVKNLQEFGYPSVDKENILTDMVYKMFFESMLKEALGQGADAEINSILEEIRNTN